MDVEISYGFLSLLPPFLAIGLALTTRQVFFALLSGIWLGYVIIAGWSPLAGTFGAIDAMINVFLNAGNTRVIVFTVVIGALIALIQRSGGVQGFVDCIIAYLDRSSAKANLQGQRKRVELLALFTGLILFVESNISILTVGTIYRPVFDRLSIAREKLAYITDSSAAPSCILLPFNAWGAFIVGLLAAQGLERPFRQLMEATFFNFYPMLVIVILLFVILSGRDIGEMKKAELRVRETGELLRGGAQPMMGGDAAQIEPKSYLKPKARNMLIPIIVMVCLMPVFLIMTGWDDSGGNWTAALQSGSGSKSVLYAVIFALLTAMTLYRIQGLLRLREMVDVSLAGMSAMLPMALMMVLAFALGALCRELGAGQYSAALAENFVSPGLVPALIFLLACFIAFSTGTSWGTFAIMIAIAVPMAQSMGTNVSLAIAAALGGGVFGDHCSPTSDTSIISAMATANDLIDHITTQLPYALIGGVITTVLYIILGFAGI